MLPFNIYSVHNLLGSMVMVPLALVFYVGYFAFGKRRIDLLFANVLVAIAVYCLVLFLEDNVVKQGQDPSSGENAPAQTLLLFRINFAIGLLWLVTQVHFVACYCQLQWGWKGGPLLLYVVAICAMPFIWTPWFTAERSEPTPGRAGWHCVVPWMPEPGPLAYAFGVLVLAVPLLCLILLCRRGRNDSDPAVAGALSQISLVRIALIVVFIGAVIDMTQGLSGYAGCCVIPISSIVMAATISVALVRERVADEKERHRLHEELRIAGEIQSGLLPEEDPDIAGFQLAGCSQAAEMAGGDTYDFLQLPGGQWLVALADASGHGMGPALIADETRAMLRALAMRSDDAAGILTQLGELLAHDLPESHFVTCFVGLLNPASAVLSYASAGQGPIVFYDASSDELQIENATGPPLLAGRGLNFLGTRPAVRQHHFEPGSFLAVISDGFYEAQNLRGEQFGVPRLVRALYQCKDTSAGEMIDCVQNALETFTTLAKQMDDRTMVVLKKL